MDCQTEVTACTGVHVFSLTCQELTNSDHAIQWRPYLMTHTSKELALGLCGCRSLQ